MSGEYRKLLATKLLVLELMETEIAVTDLIARLEEHLRHDQEVRFFQWAGGNLADVLTSLSETGRIEVRFSDPATEQRFGSPRWDQGGWLAARVGRAAGVATYMAYLHSHAGRLLKLPSAV